MYRVATALAPYASHPDLPQFHGQVEECAAELAAIGEVVRERESGSLPSRAVHGLNSEDPGVRAAAVAELEVQAALFDAMGLAPRPSSSCTWGEPRAGRGGRDRFLAGFEQLSEPARPRLVVENDDRSFSTGTWSGLPERPASGSCGTCSTTTATTPTA